MSTASAELVVRLRRDADTKNKVRFEEVVDEGGREVLRTLYVGKLEHADLGSPDELRVTIEPVSQAAA